MQVVSRNHFRRWAWPIAVTLVTLLALALRVCYLNSAVVDHPVRGDSRQYYAYALNVAYNGTFAPTLPDQTPIVPDNYRDPGYPAFLAAWMRGFGAAEAWYKAVLHCQAVLGALTVGLATLLGGRWLSRRWSIAAGVLMACWPHSITITGYLLTETLFSFLCTLGLLLASYAFSRRSFAMAAGSGFTFGAAALTNAMLLPFGLLLASLLAWRRLASPRVCATLAAAALLLPAAWAVRNAQLPPASARGGSSLDRAMQNLVQGSWPTYHANWRAATLGTGDARDQGRMGLLAIDHEYRALRASPKDGLSMMLARMAKHPVRFATWYLVGKPHLLWNWSVQIADGDIYVYPTLNSPFQTRPTWIALEVICRAINLSLMLLALAAVFISTRTVLRKNASAVPQAIAALTPTACLVVYATLVYSLLQAEPRYAIPFRPFEILLAFTSLSAAITWWKSKRPAVT